MMKKITATIPDLHEEKLREIAESEGRTLSSVVSFAIEIFLRDYGYINKSKTSTRTAKNKD